MLPFVSIEWTFYEHFKTLFEQAKWDYHSEGQTIDILYPSSELYQYFEDLN